MTTAQSVGDGDDGTPLSRIDSFLEAKLRPPAPRWNWVRRDRLVRALDRATADCAVTLLAAPAGYGKTTVIAQWLSEPTARRSAWVALDVADNDPARLWTHVAMALQRAGCRFADDPAAEVAANATEILTKLLPRLLDAVGRASEPVVLVLDDFQSINSGACHEQIGFFLAHLPSRAAVVLLTRADPALRLGRMRATGQLAEIRAEQLAFNLEETSALLAQEDIHLTDAALAGLLDRTEGWPAGLYLVTLSVAGRDDPDEFVRGFAGDDRYIGDYLVEEVLSLQPRDVRAFILAASIFERFSAALCDYVLQTTSSSAILRDLERSNLFLISLDAKREWFRFHHLFAAVARSELEMDDPGLLQRLHQRGADWFAAHGHVDAAVRHAIAAGAPARAARLVQANWIRYVDAGRAATVEAWLHALRRPGVDADPAASVTAAWMAMIRGDEPALDDLLRALADVQADGALPDGTRSVESALALIQGISGYGGPAAMLTAAERAVALETDERSPWFGLARCALGHARYLAGDLESATGPLSKAAYSDRTFAMIRQLALSAMAMIARERGNLELSGRHAEQAMAVVEASSLRAVPQSSLAYTVLGESRADQGKLDAAIEMLEHGLILRRRFPGLSPWPTIHHLLAMGRVMTVAGDLDRAGQLLDEAGQVMSRYADGMEAMRARLAAARAQLRRRGSADQGPEPLTGREVEVLRLLQSSLSLTEIANALYLSRNTVKTHAQAVYRKLGARSRSEAVHIARRRALI